MKKPKLGRPVADPTQGRMDVRLHVNVTEGQHKALLAEAERVNLPLPVWMRKRLTAKLKTS